MLNLGQRIVQLRKAYGFSQSALEKKIGVKRTYLSKIENNELDNPTYSTLRKIASGFDISLSDLLQEDIEGTSTEGLLRIANARLETNARARSEKTKIAIAQLEAVISTLEALNIGGE